MNLPVFNPIYSLGHSLHAPETFCGLLLHNDIQGVVDVRSSPFSRRAPHFGRGALQSILHDVGIRYSFSGQSLGGRPSDPAMYTNGQADYQLMANSEQFKTGLRLVARTARKLRLALICSEADPIECHRFLLIGRALHTASLQVFHIAADGRVETHSEAERRMLVATKLSQGDVFTDVGDSIVEAYRRQSARFAFRLSGLALPARESA